MMVLPARRRRPAGTGSGRCGADDCTRRQAGCGSGSTREMDRPKYGLYSWAREIRRASNPSLKKPGLAAEERIGTFGNDGFKILGRSRDATPKNCLCAHHQGWRKRNRHPQSAHRRRAVGSLELGAGQHDAVDNLVECHWALRHTVLALPVLQLKRSGRDGSLGALATATESNAEMGDKDGKNVTAGMDFARKEGTVAHTNGCLSRASLNQDTGHAGWAGSPRTRRTIHPDACRRHPLRDFCCWKTLWRASSAPTQ